MNKKKQAFLAGGAIVRNTFYEHGYSLPEPIDIEKEWRVYRSRESKMEECQGDSCPGCACCWLKHLKPLSLEDGRLIGKYWPK